MKKLIKLLVFVLMIGGLGAAVFLVVKNQETRRGAAVVVLQPQFIPDKATFNVGDTFTVAVGINAGDNKLTAVDMKIKFDSSKLRVVTVTPVLRTTGVGTSASGVGQPLFRQADNVLSDLGNLIAINQNGILPITGYSLYSSGAGESTTVAYDENSPYTLSSGFVPLVRIQFKVETGGGSSALVTVDPNSKATVYTDALSEVMTFDASKGAVYTLLGEGGTSFYSRGGCDTQNGGYSCVATNDSGQFGDWQGWSHDNFATFLSQGKSVAGFVMPQLPFDAGGLWPNSVSGTQFRLVGYKGSDRWARNLIYDVGSSSFNWGDWEYTPNGLGTVPFSGAPDTITRFWSKPDKSAITVWMTKGNSMWELTATQVPGTDTYGSWSSWKEVPIFQIPNVTGPYETMTRFPANPENTVQTMIVTKNGNRYAMRWTWDSNTSSWVGTNFNDPVGLWPVSDQPNRFDIFGRIPVTLDGKRQVGLLIRGVDMWLSVSDWTPNYSDLASCQDAGASCLISPTPTGVSTTEAIPTGFETPQPTVTPNGVDSVLDVKMAFKGLVADGQCIGNLPLQVIVLGNGVSASYANVIPTRVGVVNGVAVYEVKTVLTGFNQRDNVAVFLKAPKYLQMKYGVDGQSDFYNQAGGQLTLTTDYSTSTVYDFSKYPLMPGDIDQSGVINGLDYALLKADAVVHKSVGSQQSLATDLDGDCVVTTNDSRLFKSSLDDKQSQLY